jgi:uncharacterized protein (TIGR00255 family)
MTGFARVEGAFGDWSWSVEARSVNGRNLDVRFKGPAGLDVLERLTREAAQARFQRGQINVAVQGRRATPARSVRINPDTLDLYLRFGEGLVATGRAFPPSVDSLLALPGVVELVEQAEEDSDRIAVEAAMMVSIGDALDALGRNRAAEGAQLASVLGAFIDRIAALTAAATQEAGEHPALIKSRLERRMVELLGDRVEPERIVQEAAAMAVKADVREELDRLNSHVAAARALVCGDGASGRRFDFLTQEFMREANTLCSKSASATLTAIGLDLKATIDQFREQVQNVE